MKKACRFITIYSLGIVTAVVGYMLCATPPSKLGTTVVPYSIDTGKAVLWGGDINAQFTQADMYLYTSSYLLQRQKGIAILEQLAAKNLVAAMVRLSNYYLSEAVNAWLPQQTTAHAEKALFWARKAADQGNPYPLARYAGLYVTQLVNLQPTDLALLETLAPIGKPVANNLASYYQQRDAAKAAYWQNYANTTDFPADIYAQASANPIDQKNHVFDTWK